MELDQTQDELGRRRNRRAQLVASQAAVPGRAAFLAAWKQAVALAGPRLFYCDGVERQDQATSVEQIRPDRAAIERYLETCSLDDGVFIAAVCTFFDHDWPQTHLERFGYASIAGLAGRLDRRRLETLRELMRHYGGWLCDE